MLQAGNSKSRDINQGVLAVVQSPFDGAIIDFGLILSLNLSYSFLIPEIESDSLQSTEEKIGHIDRHSYRPGV